MSSNPQPQLSGDRWHYLSEKIYWTQSWVKFNSLWYIRDQSRWFKDAFWPESQLIYRKCPLLAVGAAQGPLWREVEAALCWGQLVPENPAQGRAEAWGHAGGTSGTAYLRKHQRGRRREQKGETAEGTPRSEEEEELHGGADIPHGKTMLGQRKDVRRKEQWTETARLIFPPSHTTCLVEEAECDLQS